MRKCLIGFLALLLIISLVPMAYAQDVVKLKSANYLPPTHPMSKLNQWFCDEVKKRTNGSVEIKFYPGGTLLNPLRMYVGITTGIADIGFSHIGYTRGRFPITETLDVPNGYPSGYIATQVSNDFYQKYQPKEWKDVEVLYLATSPPLVVHTASKRISNLEEMSGVKIRATGQMAEVIKALGGVPVPLAMPDVYESMKRGVLEGVTCDLSPLVAWRFVEVAKYTTAAWQLGTTYTFYFAISKRKWNKLNDAQKKVMKEVAMEAKDKQAALWNAMEIRSRDYFTKKAGGEIVYPAADEIAKWKKLVEPVVEKHIAALAKKGNKEADIKAMISYIQERIQYWKEQEKAKGIAAAYSY
jgi:TRAP-type C4-dicarboxylate transport system substrate-binding protein